MDTGATPYRVHLFVCTNDRGGQRKACADGGALAVHARLRAEVETRGWKPRVRVSRSGCLGLCAKGPNVLAYPQGRWFRGVTEADCEGLLAWVGMQLAGEA